MKHKGNFKDERVPKKSCSDKHCDLCKKHGGAHMTHNTADCKKFGKYGSLKKGFKKPNGQSDPKGNQNFATILKEGFAEMTKILKDKKLSKKRTIKDSDSDWLIRWGSTGELELVENKPKKVKLASYNSPGPIKTTQLESNINSSDLELNNHSLS